MREEERERRREKDVEEREEKEGDDREGKVRLLHSKFLDPPLLLLTRKKI